MISGRLVRGQYATHTRISAVNIVCIPYFVHRTFVGRGVVFVFTRSLLGDPLEKDKNIRKTPTPKTYFIRKRGSVCVCVFCVYFNCLHSSYTKTKDRFHRVLLKTRLIVFGTYPRTRARVPRNDLTAFVIAYNNIIYNK